MRKLIFVLLFVFILAGCDSTESFTVDEDLHLLPGQDTVEVFTDWIDAGAEMVINGLTVKAEVLEAVVLENEIDTSVLGIYQVNYAVEYSGETYTISRFVIVVDQIAPEITLNIGIDTVIIGEDWTDEGVTIIDNSLEVIVATLTGTVDTDTVGRYVITYTAVDSSGNETSVDRIVNVID